MAEHDPARFVSGAANFLTQDAESSGIIDASDVQVHRSNPDPSLVEHGQLLIMTVTE